MMGALNISAVMSVVLCVGLLVLFARQRRPLGGLLVLIALIGVTALSLRRFNSFRRPEMIATASSVAMKTPPAPAVPRPGSMSSDSSEPPSAPSPIVVEGSDSADSHDEAEESAQKSTAIVARSKTDVTTVPVAKTKRPRTRTTAQYGPGIPAVPAALVTGAIVVGAWAILRAGVRRSSRRAM